VSSFLLIHVHVFMCVPFLILMVLCTDPFTTRLPSCYQDLSKSDFQQLEVTHRNLNEQKHKWRKNMLGCGLCAK
jgi:hypothetical protein